MTKLKLQDFAHLMGRANSLEKTLAPWKESYDQPRQHIKEQKYYFANKGPSNQGYGFSSSHVWIWELDYKESITEEVMLFNCGVGEDS